MRYRYYPQGLDQTKGTSLRIDWDKYVKTRTTEGQKGK